MRFKRKEKEKLLSRRKLWSLFGWFWAYKKDNGDTYYTCDENDGGGMGYLKNHHSLNCGCRDQTRYKRELKKKVRIKRKNKIRELMKVIKGQNDLD